MSNLTYKNLKYIILPVDFQPLAIAEINIFHQQSSFYLTNKEA